MKIISWNVNDFWVVTRAVRRVKERKIPIRIFEENTLPFTLDELIIKC